MHKQEQTYQLPESTGKEVRRMIIWMAWFFGVLSLLVIVFLIYAPTLMKLVPFSAEKKFVRPYEEFADKWWDGESHDEITAYLQELTDRLSKAMELKEEIQIQAHYITSEEVNAFAVLGGHIFITKGLMQAVDNENALAMVVAHELAHQKNRDPITSLSRGLAVQLIYTLATSDYSQFDLSGLGANVGLNYFSREQEALADEAAMYALQTHYGHVSGYDQFFRVVLDVHEGHENIPEWLSTHPDTQSRIDELEQIKVENNWQLGEATPLPEEILRLIQE